MKINITIKGLYKIYAPEIGDIWLFIQIESKGSTTVGIITLNKNFARITNTLNSSGRLPCSS